MADAGADHASADPDNKVASHDPNASNTNGASEQPRTIGGFIVDDDEDEEYTPMLSKAHEAVASLGATNVDRGASETPQRSPSESASNTLPSHDITSSDTAKEKDESGALANGHTDAAPAPAPAPVRSNSGAPEETSHATQPSLNMPDPSQTPVPSAADAASTSVPKARLPHDRVGILEDRIKEDPRGDKDAWLSLISEHRKRGKLDDARNAYERFFKVFPTVAEQWVAYANMELENNDFYRVEQIFNKSLLNVPNVQLWSTYLNYVRRRNNLTTDQKGNARKIVSETYEFVLQHIGIDKDAGPLWQDYVQFIRSSPEQIGGTSWQDQQKMDTLRRVYQRAICIPTEAVHPLWKEYDAFEMGLNKQTGRKFLQEKSPAYMTARSANTALQNLTRGLNRTTFPSLPPALGFEGDVEYVKQVEIWKKWIDWEKEDPLVLKDEDEGALKSRILYAYKQALMALRFWPEMWFDAAEFCFENGLEQEGNDLLTQGIGANPESCLLAFKRADRIEATTTKEEGDESIIRRGVAVREPYDKVLDALYELCGQIKQRESQAISRIKETFAKQETSATGSPREQDDDDAPTHNATDSDAAMNTQIEAVQKGFSVQLKLLSKTISYAWIALMRAMRRVQGKGKLGEPIGGSRQIFADARRRGRLTSDVYVASALIEYHCYKDVAATKIFDRGMKLFPEDEMIALEYMKHLVNTNDITNARSVFETSVTRLTQTPQLTEKAKPLFVFFHEFESRYGELSQVNRLEKRMRDLYPEDPQLRLFSQRFASPDLDPTAVRPIISPAVQAKPKGGPGQGPTDKPPSVQSSPRPPPVIPTPQITISPKRQLDESDLESVPPRKLPRSESPLKGAAGRRLDAQKRTQLRKELAQPSNATVTPAPSGPPPLPSDVHYLLSIMPRAESYNATYFVPDKMVSLLRGLDLSKASVERAQQLQRQALQQQPQSNQPQYGYQPPSSSYGYQR